MTWFGVSMSEVLDLATRHAWLSAVPVVLGFVIALPIGWYSSRHPRRGGVLLSVSSILYTIPSLPLLVILPSIIGTGFLSATNIIVALTMYAVAIMVRSSADAFGAVSDTVLDSATASGFSTAQRVLRVQLPLAGPVLLAGVRVVSVSTVSLVSISSLVGVSSLGSLFTDGYNRDFTAEIVMGVAATVVLAVIFDLILVTIGRLLLPWSHVTSRAGASA